MDWRGILAVLAGGGIGSVLRYAVTFWMTQRLGPGFPWATFAINVTGSLVIGIVAELTQTRALGGSALVRLFLMTGVLGGYTTFSTFSLDTGNLLRDGNPAIATAYVGGSVLLGVVAALGGIALVRAVSAA